MKITDREHNFYLVNLEEKDSDIRWMIRYDDDGDEFILVCCTGGTMYQYGWFMDQEDTDHYTYIRDHVLFAPSKRPDTNHFSIYNREPEYYYKAFVGTDHGPHMFRRTRIEVYGSNEKAQRCFDFFIESLYRAFNDGYEYNFDDRYDYELNMTRYRVVLTFLEYNKIDTVENLEKLINAPTHSKTIDGCRGIAAKCIFESDYIMCDNLSYVYVDGEWLYQWGTPVYYPELFCGFTPPKDSSRPSKKGRPFDIPYYEDQDDCYESMYTFSINDINNALSQTRLNI